MDDYNSYENEVSTHLILNLVVLQAALQMLMVGIAGVSHSFSAANYWHIVSVGTNFFGPITLQATHLRQFQSVVS